jgi:ABC-type branched-subunit amino acid transport system ATPase component
MTEVQERLDAVSVAPALQLEGISVRFGGVHALTDVTMDARPGEVTGLIGPNGAGKSTMLAVASGLQVPVAGKVILEGNDLTGRSPQAFAKARMARTFQSPQLVKDLDVRQHLVLAFRVRTGRSLVRDFVSAFKPKISADEKERSDQLLESLGLSSVAHLGPADLPLGTRRLVGVAQCIAMDPKVLLLDEPTAGLNKGETDRFAELVTSISRDRGIATVLVEHDIDLVLSISTRIFVIEFGKLIASGSPAEIRINPAVQAAYLGTTEADA